MGVKGLWTLLEPAARPVRLEALAHKRLAVDASIWLYQLVKAMKDAEGNPIEDAHILGFYRRVCKLLYYGIQPVFVFDGGAPELKRITINERQAMRGSHTNDAKRAAHQLLQTQLKLHALDGVAGAETMAQTAMDQTQQDDAYETSPSKKRKRDEYELPPLQSQALATRTENERDLRMAHPEDLRQVLAAATRHPESLGGLESIDIDTESAEFKSLAPEDQHDLIVALKVRSRQTSHDRLQHMLQSSDNALDFSKQQIELLTKRNTLTQQWLQVTGNAHRITSLSGSSNVTVGRVAGERSREYILARSDQPGGGWTLKLGGGGSGDTVNSEDMHVDSAAVGSLDREAEPAITVQSSDSEDSDSVEFENVPPASGNLEATADGADIQAQEQDNAQYRGHGAYDMGVVSGHPVLSSRNAVQVAEEVGAEYAEYPQLSSDDEDEEEEDDNMASISSSDAEIDAELMDLYGECESMDLVSPQEKQKHQQRMREQREREEQAILEMPAPEFLDTWSQLVTQPILKADPRIYEDMQGWLLEAPLARLQECAWRANRQLEKLPDVPIANDYEDDDNSENNGMTGNSANGSSAKLDLKFIQTKIARLSLISNYLSFAQRWRQQHSPSQNGIKAELAMSAAGYTDDGAEIISVESESESEDDGNFEIPQAISPQALASDRQPDNGKTFTDYDNNRLSVPFLNSDDIERLASEAAADDKRDVIFEKSRGLAAMGPDGKNQGTDARIDAAAKPTLHIDSASESGSLSEVSLAEDDVLDVANGITGELALDDVSVADLGAGRPGEDDDGGDDDVSDGDLDTPNSRRTELLKDEQDEYARFVSKLKASAPGVAMPKNTSYHTMRAELEDELQSLRTRVRDTKRNASGVEADMVEDIRMLLTLFGVPYVTAPMEAEAQCAALVSSGLVDGMVTDDSDAFLFASSDRTQVYRHFFQKDRYVEMYSSSDIFQDSSLTQRDLVFLACLLGSDYTVGVKGIGPVLAIEALAEFGPSVTNGGTTIDDRTDEEVVVEALRGFRSWCDSITGVLPGMQLPNELVDTSLRRRLAQVIRKSGVPERFPDPRVVHAYFHPQVDPSEARFEWGFPKLDMLRQFLSGRLGWSAEKTDETLVPLVRKMVDAKDVDSNARSQTTLDLFAPRAGHAMGAVYEAAGIGHSRRVGAAISSHKKRLLSSRTSAVQK
ncbi:DNA repair protein rad2 [Coemansia guatemalensis]|uniref:DNA repair protein rad2 n=1 Tax=Coemansia guatemalensis TaxID=2761395 RepID=A0A9W8LSA3_9FUNG|nr:DNA repair protein rad2 [Coemansia guatemalensis]